MRQFAGSWKLVSSEFQLADGKSVFPYGRCAVGMLSYGTDGKMSVQIMRSDRPVFVSGDIARGAPEEIRTAFDGYLAYFGTYEVNASDSTVIHHIEGSLFPNWVGQDQKRYYEFSGNRLLLRTPPMPARRDTTLTGVLTWERIV